MAGVGVAAVFMIIGLHLALPKANILPRYDTWMNRIDNRVDAADQSIESLQANQQANNAKLAISVGSVFGQGVGDGKLKEFLPEAYADFYYATFVEEFGFVSAFILVLLYLILLYRIIRFALKTQDLFQSYVDKPASKEQLYRNIIDFGDKNWMLFPSIKDIFTSYLKSVFRKWLA